MEFTIRAATVDDCQDLMRMIRDLGVFEDSLDEVVVTQKVLERDGFGKDPLFHALIAEVPEDQKARNGHTKVAYTLFYYGYNSFTGRTIHMDDLYVMPEFRGDGIGKALISKVTQLGLAAGCTQLNFIVKNTNKPAINFYVKRGCFNVTETYGYHCMRCEGEALQRLAQI